MAGPGARVGWTRVTFGDVVRQVRDVVDPEEAGLERYVAGEHMDTDDLRIRRWGTVGDGYLGPAFHMRFKPGQVLYGSRRTYLRKVAVAAFEGVTANTTFVLEPKDPGTLLAELLPFVMQTEGFHEHSIRQSKGSVNPYINFSDLTWYDFDLPPLDEQRRIADVLRAIDSALDGLLSIQSRGAQLLSSVVDDATRRARDTGSLVPLQDLIEADRPITYGILKPGIGFPGGVPVVKVKDYPDGQIKEDDLLRTDPKIDHEYRRSRLRPGDLLISIRGTVGRLAFVPPSLDGANITQDTARLSLRNEHDHHYLRTMLESSYVQRQVAAFITGLAVKGINIGELRKIMIPLVQQEQQGALVREVAAIQAAMHAAEERVSTCRLLRRSALVGLEMVAQ